MDVEHLIGEIKSLVTSNTQTDSVSFKHAAAANCSLGAGFSNQELLQLSRNAFDISWTNADQKQAYLAQIDEYGRQA